MGMTHYGRVSVVVFVNVVLTVVLLHKNTLLFNKTKKMIYFIQYDFNQLGALVSLKPFNRLIESHTYHDLKQYLSNSILCNNIVKSI